MLSREGVPIWTPVDELLHQILPVVLRLVAAYCLAFPIGFERGSVARKTGFRTFPLVAIGACAYLSLGRDLADNEPNADARVLQGLLGGIGFIGGGVILKSHGSVRGLATAASLWNTGAVGAAVAYNEWTIAITLAIVNLATMHFIEGPSHREEHEAHEASERGEKAEE